MLDDLGVTAVDATDVEHTVLAQARPLPALLSPRRRLATFRAACMRVRWFDWSSIQQATGREASAERDVGEQSPAEQRRELRQRIRAVEREAAAVQTVLDRSELVGGRNADAATACTSSFRALCGGTRCAEMRLPARLETGP